MGKAIVINLNDAEHDVEMKIFDFLAKVHPNFSYTSDLKKYLEENFKVKCIDRNQMEDQATDMVKMARNWNDLPNEMKWMIVDNMDIITRTNLKMCSKSDKCIVESVPFHVENFEAHCTPYVLDIGDVRIFEEKNDTISKRIDGKSSQLKLPKKLQKYKTKFVFRKFVSNLLLSGNIHMDHFDTNMDFPSKLSNTTIDTKSASFFGKSEEITKWVNVLPRKTESIDIFNNDDGMLEGIGSIQAIINAKEVRISRTNDITDEQLMTFKFTRGSIEKSKITKDGAEKFLLHIMSNDYPMDTVIEIFFINDIENNQFAGGNTGYEGNELETRFCLPMNSEKEVVYFYNPFVSRFTYFVQEAGRPVRTFKQHYGYYEDDGMEEGRDTDYSTHESSDFDDDMDEY